MTYIGIRINYLADFHITLRSLAQNVTVSTLTRTLLAKIEIIWQFSEYFMLICEIKIFFTKYLHYCLEQISDEFGARKYFQTKWCWNRYSLPNLMDIRKYYLMNYDMFSETYHKVMLH